MVISFVLVILIYKTTVFIEIKDAILDVVYRRFWYKVLVRSYRTICHDQFVWLNLRYHAHILPVARKNWLVDKPLPFFHRYHSLIGTQ